MNIPLTEVDLEKTISEIEGQGPRLITAIHPEDEMYLFIAAHPALKDDPLKHYFLSGVDMMRSLSAILSVLKMDLGSTRRFLEFACGYGRFTRHLIRHLDPAKITGSDLYPGAVDFQRATFGVSGFYSHLVPEELEIESPYDVIFVASLFSHLPESVWERWLKKLYDSLERGGTLIFSTHGPTTLPADWSIPPSGFLFNRVSESKTHSLDDYGSTFVSSAYVHESVRRATGQEVVLEVVRGLFNYQDVFAVRRP